MQPSVRRTIGTINKINKAEMGLGGVIVCNDGTVIKAGCCGNFPQDAQIGNKYNLLLSFNHILESIKIE